MIEPQVKGREEDTRHSIIQLSGHPCVIEVGKEDKGVKYNMKKM